MNCASMSRNGSQRGNSKFRFQSFQASQDVTQKILERIQPAQRDSSFTGHDNIVVFRRSCISVARANLKQRYCLVRTGEVRLFC